MRQVGVSGYQKSSGSLTGTVTEMPASAASLAARLRQSTLPARKPSSASALSSGAPPPCAKALLMRSPVIGDQRSRGTHVRRRLLASTHNDIGVLQPVVPVEDRHDNAAMAGALLARIEADWLAAFANWRPCSGP